MQVCERFRWKAFSAEAPHLISYAVSKRYTNGVEYLPSLWVWLLAQEQCGTNSGTKALRDVLAPWAFLVIDFPFSKTLGNKAEERTRRFIKAAMGAGKLRRREKTNGRAPEEDWAWVWDQCSSKQWWIESLPMTMIVLAAGGDVLDSRGGQ